MLKKSLGTAVVFLLLCSVPASAITFLGGWNVRARQVRGAPAPALSVSDFLGGSRLTMGMGKLQGGVSSRSFVRATRLFTVREGGETVRLGHGFRSFIRNTKVRFFAVIRSMGPSPTSPVRLRLDRKSKRGGGFAAFQDTIAARLAPGDYRITVRLRYLGSGRTTWDNDTSGVASAHLFTLSSM